MNNEAFTAAEFVRGVTWAPSMQARIEIAGVPYVVGELLADVATDDEREILNDVFAYVVGMSLEGDERAKKLIKALAEKFAYGACPPEPEPDDIPEPRTLGRSDGAVPGWMTREGAAA